MRSIHSSHCYFFYFKKNRWIYFITGETSGWWSSGKGRRWKNGWTRTWNGFGKWWNFEVCRMSIYFCNSCKWIKLKPINQSLLGYGNLQCQELHTEFLTTRKSASAKSYWMSFSCSLQDLLLFSENWRHFNARYAIKALGTKQGWNYIHVLTQDGWIIAEYICLISHIL